MRLALLFILSSLYGFLFFATLGESRQKTLVCEKELKGERLHLEVHARINPRGSPVQNDNGRLFSVDLSKNDKLIYSSDQVTLSMAENSYNREKEFGLQTSAGFHLSLKTDDLSLKAIPLSCWPST